MQSDQIVFAQKDGNLTGGGDPGLFIEYREVKDQKEVVVVLIVVDLGALNSAEAVVEFQRMKRKILCQVFRLLFGRLLDGGPR